MLRGLVATRHAQATMSWHDEFKSNIKKYDADKTGIKWKLNFTSELNSQAFFSQKFYNYIWICCQQCHEYLSIWNRDNNVWISWQLLEIHIKSWIMFNITNGAERKRHSCWITLIPYWQESLWSQWDWRFMVLYQCKVLSTLLLSQCCSSAQGHFSMSLDLNNCIRKQYQK